MCKPSGYDLALSFWTVALQYLKLAGCAAEQINEHGNKCFVVQDIQEGPVTVEEYERQTRWSDVNMILPLLFNLLHGIELLAKGFLLAAGEEVKPVHSIAQLVCRFKQTYAQQSDLIAFFEKFTDERKSPLLIQEFLQDVGERADRLYPLLRYPSDKEFQTIRRYTSLQYKDMGGREFFGEVAQDIRRAIRAAVRLGRSLDQSQTP